MNRQDTAAVLGILGAAYPNQKLSEQTARVWMDMLTDIDPADAMAAARALVRQEHWFPSIAQFRIEADAAAHARRNRAATTRGLRSAHKPVPPPPRTLQHLRAMLTDLGARKHRHGGPDPCPICGGIKSPGKGNDTTEVIWLDDLRARPGYTAPPEETE